MKQLLPGTTIDIEIDRPDAAEPIRTSAEVVVVGVSGKSTLIVQPK